MKGTNDKEKRNQYHREWYANNKERVKAINQRYWLKKIAALAASEQSGESNDRKDNE